MPTPSAHSKPKLGIAAGDRPESQQPEVIPGYGYGYKILAVDAYGNLRSPQKQDIWKPYVGLDAGGEPVIGNSIGIYVTSAPTAYDLQQYNREPGTATITCLAKVQIWGKCVKHQNGYRAQFALPEEVTLQPDLTGPDDPQVQKLATMIRNKYAIDVKVESYSQGFEERPKPAPYNRGPAKRKINYSIVKNQADFDTAVSAQSSDIRIEGGPITIQKTLGNILVGPNGNVAMYNGSINAVGGVIQQFGGEVIARGTARIDFQGGKLRAGSDVIIEVHSPLKYVDTSRSVSGGQIWRNQQGQVYLTRYHRGQIIDRSQPHAQALQDYLENRDLGPEMRQNIEGLLKHHKYISRALEQERYISSQVEVKGDEDWTRVGSGSFTTDQKTVKCPNCSSETEFEVCPNCGKGLSVEWSKANDKAIPFDMPPQASPGANEFWTDVNPVPKQNWNKTDNSFPSMMSHKLAIETGQPETPDDKIYQDGREYGAHVAQYAVAELVGQASQEQIDEVYQGVMRGDDEAWQYMDENPLSGEMAGGPDIREIVTEAGDEIPNDENQGEWIEHYARIWLEGYHSGWLESFEELLAVQANKMDQAGSMTFPAEWTG